MPTYSCLDLPLRAEVPRTLRETIVEFLCGTQHPPLNLFGGSHLEPFYESYFTYYDTQCKLIGRHANGSFASVATHREITDIAPYLRMPYTRAEVRKLIAGFLSPADSGRHDMSINLVARLLLMMRVGSIAHECISPRRQLDWTEGSLREFVLGHFSKAPHKKDRSHKRMRLEKSFNALNLHRIAGMEIRWTDNLAEHLQMMNDDKAVAIFHYASFLKQQQGDSSMYPVSLIDETLQTIALLFPQYDQETRKWYCGVRQRSRPDLDSFLVETGALDTESRQFETFYYWHDRLVILKQVYDEARPATISQWWHDRRNPVQWYTFWVAILVVLLTLVFGFVQCVEGGLQTWKTWNP